MAKRIKKRGPRLTPLQIVIVTILGFTPDDSVGSITSKLCRGGNRRYSRQTVEECLKSLREKSIVKKNGEILTKLGIRRFHAVAGI